MSLAANVNGPVTLTSTLRPFADDREFTTPSRRQDKSYANQGPTETQPIVSRSQKPYMVRSPLMWASVVFTQSSSCSHIFKILHRRLLARPIRTTYLLIEQREKPGTLGNGLNRLRIEIVGALSKVAGFHFYCQSERAENAFEHCFGV